MITINIGGLCNIEMKYVSYEWLMMVTVQIKYITTIDWYTIEIKYRFDNQRCLTWLSNVPLLNW